MSARERFVAREYAACLDLLESAEQAELTTRHNATLTTCLMGKSSVDDLLSSLRQLVANAARFSPSLGKAASVETTSPRYVDYAQLGAEVSTVLFNLASIYFSRHQNERARQIVETLFDKLTVVPLDIGLSIKVCLLLLEVNLRIWSARGGAPCESEDQRSIMQQRMTSVFGQLDEFVALLSKTSPADSASASESGQSNGNSNGKHVAPGSDGPNISSVLQFRTLLYRARVLVCFNRLASASEEARKAMALYDSELKRFAMVADTTTSTSPPIVANVAFWGYTGPEQLKRQYQLACNISAHVTCLQGGSEVSMTELAKLSQMTSTPASTASTGGAPSAAEIINNMACVFLKDGKVHAGELFFRQALELERTKAGTENTARLVPPYEGCMLQAGTQIFDMLYNEGVALLLAGQPKEAFACLEKTVPVLGPRLPHLWIRMAECCIHLAHRVMQAASNDLTSNLSPSGEPVASSSSKTTELQQGPGSTSLSMLEARNYLTVALGMIRQRSSSSSPSIALEKVEEKSSDDNKGDELELTGAEFDTDGEALTSLEELVLTHLAYVNLSLGDYMLAVVIAREILAKTGIKQETRHAATTYLAEGLLVTGKTSEAAELYANTAKDTSVEGCFVPSAWGDGTAYSSLYASSGTDIAKLCSDVNAAAAALLNGNVEDAKATLEGVLASCPSFAPAIKGLVYIKILQDEPKEALKKLLIN